MAAETVKKLRKHAKEITLDCERRGYSVEETKLLGHVLNDEIKTCTKQQENELFHAGI